MIAALGRVNDVQGLRVIAGINTWQSQDLPKTAARNTQLFKASFAELHINPDRLDNTPQETVLAIVRALCGHPKDALDICRVASPEIRAHPALAIALLNSLTMRSHGIYLRQFLIELIQWRNALLQDTDRLAGTLVKCLEMLTTVTGNSSNQSMAPALIARTFIVAREMASVINILGAETDVEHAARVLDQQLAHQL
ncbi:hypothetical protein BDF19DRAFT_417427 [Syncephalis fuscata]|nr:hypothetical protein BDF19DRAFT_417427 [Syncephalis fuscata]